MSERYGLGFAEPVIFTYVDANAAIVSANSESRKYYRNGILYLSIERCQIECTIYANDNRTQFLVHLTPGSSGMFRLPAPSQSLLFVWGNIAAPLQNTDIVLFGFSSQDAPLWQLQNPSILDTIFTRSILAGGPAPPPLTTLFPTAAQLAYGMLAFMVASDAITTGADTTVETHALANARLDLQSREQLLAVVPYTVQPGAANGVPWAGSVAISGTPNVNVVNTPDVHVTNVPDVHVTNTPAVTISGTPTVLAPQQFVNAFGVSTGVVSNAFTAATTTQIVTFYHPNTSTVRVRILWLVIEFLSASVATNIDLSLIRLSATTAPSGGTGLTESPYETGNTPDTEVISLPGVAGSTVGGQNRRYHLRLGVTGAASVVNPPVVPVEVPMIPPGPPWFSGAIIRAGNAEGWALRLASSANSTIDYAVSAMWTEE